MKLAAAGGPASSLRIDLASPVSLARTMRFDADDPRHFDAPAPRRRPLVLPGFEGQVSRGASCNCAVIELTPHCNGTHTESVAHLVVEPRDVCELVPLAPLPALLLTLDTLPAAGSDEDSDPAPQPDDWLLTRAALCAAWPATLPFSPRALVLRTGTGGHRDPAQASPIGAAPTAAQTTPYLSRQLATELVARGIEHLVVDLPSIDRGHDRGRLCGHRLFFGLPPGSTRLAEAGRPDCTITELAAIPASLPDGPYALQLTLPQISGDAIPSRPLLYRVETV
ncbi:MAG: cyclase family protein [Sinobacteraceae bacterium]|nr:cyclase family protein [Nevskiaceae bacterium]